MKIHAPLLLAALTLVACETYDAPAGRATVARSSMPSPVMTYTPAPAPAPVTEAPAPVVVSQQQPAVQATAPQQYVATPAPAPVAAPTVNYTTRAAASVSRTAIPQYSPYRKTAPKEYPVMPGQNRGLKSRAW